MNIKDYFIKINKKLDELDEAAKNPMLEHNFSYNPFEGAFSQTYVWVEKTKKNEDERQKEKK